MTTETHGKSKLESVNKVSMSNAIGLQDWTKIITTIDFLCCKKRRTTSEIRNDFHIYKLLPKKGSVINQKAAGESAAVACCPEESQNFTPPGDFHPIHWENTRRVFWPKVSRG